MIMQTRRRRGAIVVLMAVMLVPILGIVAISVDGGMLLDHECHLPGWAKLARRLGRDRPRCDPRSWSHD